MTKQAQNSSIDPKEIKPEAVTIQPMDYFKAGRGKQPIDTVQIRQKIKIGTFDITGTGDFYLNIGYTPSLIVIKAYEDGHSPFSQAMIQAQENHCIYNDSGGNFFEAAANTVIYLDHAGVTSATLGGYGPITKITCSSYNHATIVHWIAYP